MKILVTGAAGQLGMEFQELAKHATGITFSFSDRDELDITSESAVQEAIQSFKPDYCINCAAYTAVDKAETEQDAAYAINANAVGYLAKHAAACQARFIHISTDYVFNGNATEPIKEEEQTNPINVYGASKLKGEELALQNNPDAVILRTSWVYSSFGNNFVKTMLRLMSSRPELSIVADQHGCPTYAADLAKAIMAIISHSTWIPGIYHFSNAEPTTWFQFAEAIKEEARLDCELKPITTDQYPTPAKRPSYSVMDTSKIRTTYNLQIRAWKPCLEECVHLLLDK